MVTCVVTVAYDDVTASAWSRTTPLLTLEQSRVKVEFEVNILGNGGLPGKVRARICDNSAL